MTAPGGRTLTPRAVPDSLFWLSICVAVFTKNPLATSDALLCLADALAEASHHAAMLGRANLSVELADLADLPRRAAPKRAGNPS